MGADVAGVVASTHRQHWARILATVARVTRDLEAAEDLVQEAFASALQTWPRDGVPGDPSAWITKVAVRKGIDLVRRRATFVRKWPLLCVDVNEEVDDMMDESTVFPDDRLRLIFTCCHPALSIEARVALTLRLVCGLTTAEIARMFLVSETTMAARLTRAKKKIALARIPYQIPADHELTERLTSVLAVIWLLYTEGHTATCGDQLTRPELAERAVELARMLVELMPDEPEAMGLLAVLLLAESRRPSRTGPDGGLVLLEDQDRARWDKTAIRDGLALVATALARSRIRGPGQYALQAAISSVHAEAPTFADTDWPQLLALYTLLLAIQPSPVVALNRAIVVSMVDGPAAGLRSIEELSGDQQLVNYPGLYAARADMLRRLGRTEAAAASYAEAAERTQNRVQRDFLLGRRLWVLAGG